MANNVHITITLSRDLMDWFSSTIPWEPEAWNEVAKRAAKIHPTFPARDDVTGKINGNASYLLTNRCNRTPDPLTLDSSGGDHYLEITVDRIVAVQPSNSNSLTYGFLHTSVINPGIARERRTRRAVAQYVAMTFTRRDVKKVRMIKVRRSPNEEASGVAILSA